MKKMNFFKILMSLTLTLVVVGVFAQTVPDPNKPLVTVTTNYVEVLQADDGGYTGAGANDFDVHVNYVTAGTTSSLVTYVAAGADSTAAYTNAVAAPITYLVPLIVAPDPVFNPTLYAAPNFTYANITDDATWTWSFAVAPTTATFDVVDDALAAGFDDAGVSGLYDIEEYNQRYLNTGTSIETYDVNVVENSMNAAADAILCIGNISTMNFSAVGPATVAEDGGSSADIDLCYSNADGTYNFILGLVGTPPFYLGYDVSVHESVSGALSYSTVQALTDDAALSNAGVDISLTNGIGAVAPDGILAGGPVNWTYTIPLSIDVDNDNAYTNELATAASISEITTYSVRTRFINDYYSRKTDRRGTLGDPDVVGDQNSHVLYADDDARFTITLYPAPSTGNIFTLPN